jgi:hypothetical protein
MKDGVERKELSRRAARFLAAKMDAFHTGTTTGIYGSSC